MYIIPLYSEYVRTKISNVFILIFNFTEFKKHENKYRKEKVHWFDKYKTVFKLIFVKYLEKYLPRFYVSRWYLLDEDFTCPKQKNRLQ